MHAYIDRFILNPLSFLEFCIQNSNFCSVGISAVLSIKILISAHNRDLLNIPKMQFD